MVISGKITQLYPASPADRKKIYQWLACSDLTASMMGPPDFPDHPIPDYQAFCTDYAPYFFDGSAPAQGRSFIIHSQGEERGQINYQRLDRHPNIAELDIWLSEARHTGLGIGTDAIQALSTFLLEEGIFDTLLIAPSARNDRAIATYRKAGFIETADMRSDAADYSDAVVMIKRKAERR